MSKAISTILISILFTTQLGWGQFLQEENERKESSGDYYAAHTGIAYCQLRFDTLLTDPIWAPFIGVSMNREINRFMGLEIGGQLARRGSNYNTWQEYRNDYFDLLGIMNFRLSKNIVAKIGYQGSLLMASFMREYTDLVFSQYNVKDTKGFTNQSVLLIGSDLQLVEGFDIRLLYTFPFSSNEFRNLQVGFKVNLNNLLEIKRRKKFVSLDEALKKPYEVEKLVLQRKNLKEFPKEIARLPNLEVLILDGNNLTTLPPEIGNMSKLKRLSVKYNKLESLPKEIGRLTELQELNLNGNRIKELPDAIGNLSNLQFLYIGKNELGSLNSQIGNLESLIELDIAGSGVMLEIPITINNLQRLERLTVDKNTRFPYGFNPGVHLQILYK